MNRFQLSRELRGYAGAEGMTPWRIRQALRGIPDKPRSKQAHGIRPCNGRAEFCFQTVRKLLLEKGIPEGLTKKQAAAAQATLDSRERFLVRVVREAGVNEQAFRARLRGVWRRM